MAREQLIHLDWTTQSEVDSDYFDVQWSTDGRSFLSVGTVPAAGFSFTPRSYTFTHRPAYGEVHYYRLRMVDTDGSEEYSRIIAIDFQPALTTLQVHSDGAYLRVSGLPPASAGQLRILDMMGRPVWVQQHTPDQEASLLDVPFLPAGPYILQWQPEGGALQALPFIRP